MGDFDRQSRQCDRRLTSPGQGGVRDIHLLQTIPSANYQVATNANLHLHATYYTAIPLAAHQQCSHLPLDNKANHMTIDNAGIWLKTL
jgi:hypothetical protein